MPEGTVEYIPFMPEGADAVFEKLRNSLNNLVNQPVRPKTPSIRPIGTRVVVEVAPPEETTPSGIVLPNAAQRRPQEGVVVAVGPEFNTLKSSEQTPAVQAGDRILFARNAGTEVKVGEKEYLILDREQVYAVLGGV